jgi:hypothetical protein
LGETAFYAQLAEEKVVLKNMIEETKSGKMNMYLLSDINNKNSEKHRTLKFVLDELTKQYLVYDPMLTDKIKYLK